MIKYTEDVADRELHVQLFNRLGGGGEKLSESAGSNGESSVTKTKIKKVIRISAGGEEDGIETTTSKVDAPQGKPENTTPVAESTVEQKPSAIKPIIKSSLNFTNSSKTPKQSVPGVVPRRAVLTSTRTPRTDFTALGFHDDDFSDGRSMARPTTIRPTPARPPMRAGLSASKVAKSKPLLKRATQTIASAPVAAAPLSHILAQTAKRTRPKMSDDVEEFESYRPVSPPVIDQPSTSQFATPPRPSAMAPLPSGSSGRRRNLVDTGSSVGLLMTMLRNARSRVAQDWSSLSAESSSRASSKNCIKVKIVSATSIGEHLSAMAEVLVSADESELAIGKCIPCIVPYVPFDPEEKAIQTTLRNLGHVRPDAHLEGRIIIIHAPWKLVTLEDMERVLICSGLVTLATIEIPSSLPV